MKSQNDIVLDYIKRHGRITTWDAIRLRITRLSARIYDLKRRGYTFSKARVNYKSNGRHMHYDVYMLGGDSL